MLRILQIYSLYFIPILKVSVANTFDTAESIFMFYFNMFLDSTL